MSEGSTAATVLGRGAVAGVAGTVVMTAFQKFVEMPITGRSDSYAPADFAEKVFRLTPGTPNGTTAPEQRDPPGAWHDVGRGVRARRPGGAQGSASRGGGVRHGLRRRRTAEHRSRAVPATGLVGRSSKRPPRARSSSASSTRPARPDWFRASTDQSCSVLKCPALLGKRGARRRMQRQRQRLRLGLSATQRPPGIRQELLGIAGSAVGQLRELTGDPLHGGLRLIAALR